MSKRFVGKLAVMAVTLGAVTLLQGCGDDDDRVFVYSPYMPCIPGVTFASGGVAFNPSAPAGGSQQDQGGSSGVGAASAAAHGGGGSAQVSGGVGY